MKVVEIKKKFDDLFILQIQTVTLCLLVPLTPKTLKTSYEFQTETALRAPKLLRTILFISCFLHQTFL